MRIVLNNKNSEWRIIRKTITPHSQSTWLWYSTTLLQRYNKHNINSPSIISNLPLSHPTYLFIMQNEWPNHHHLSLKITNHRDSWMKQTEQKYAVSFASLKKPSSWSNALQSLHTVEYLEFINPQRPHFTVAEVSSITSRVFPVISTDGEASVRNNRIDSESSASTLEWIKKGRNEHGNHNISVSTSNKKREKSYLLYLRIRFIMYRSTHIMRYGYKDRQKEVTAGISSTEVDISTNDHASSRSYSGCLYHTFRTLLAISHICSHPKKWLFGCFLGWF